MKVAKETHLLFKVINLRYNDDRSLIFTINITEEDWAEVMGDPISTNAIVDRVFHHSVIVAIRSPSYRKHRTKLLQKKYWENKLNDAASG